MKKLVLMMALTAVVSVVAESCPGGVCARTSKGEVTRGVAYPYDNGYYGPKKVHTHNHTPVRGVAYPVNDAAYGEAEGVQYYGPEATN
jgi:hypothetical protein